MTGLVVSGYYQQDMPERLHSWTGSRILYLLTPTVPVGGPRGDRKIEFFMYKKYGSYGEKMKEEMYRNPGGFQPGFQV